MSAVVPASIAIDQAQEITALKVALSQETDRADRYFRLWGDDVVALKAALNLCSSQFEKQRVEHVLRVERLKGYAVHVGTCPARMLDVSEDACTCGLLAVLRQVTP